MRFLLVLALFSVASLAACGGGAALPKMPVDEAKALSAELTQSQSFITNAWADVQNNAGTIAHVDANVPIGDVDEFRSMLQECFQSAPTKAVAEEGVEKDGVITTKDAKIVAMVGYESVSGCSTNKLDSLTDAADDEAKTFYTSKFQQVEKIRTDVYLIPLNAQALIEASPKALAEIAEIRVKAEAALAATEKNPIASSKQKAKAKEDYALVISELDAVETGLKKLVEDIKSLPTDVPAVVTQIASDIENIGR